MASGNRVKQLPVQNIARLPSEATSGNRTKLPVQNIARLPSEAASGNRVKPPVQNIARMDKSVNFFVYICVKATPQAPIVLCCLKEIITMICD